MGGVLDVAKDESRKVVIKLTNYTKQPWKNPRIFLDSGTAEDILPLEIANEKEVEYEVHKKKMDLQWNCRSDQLPLEGFWKKVQSGTDVSQSYDIVQQLECCDQLR